MGIEQSAQSIADALAPTAQGPAVKWRWGTVEAVGEHGTMDVAVGGSTLYGIRAARHCMGASIGDRVRVSYYGTEALVDAIRATDNDYPASFGLRSGSYSIPSGSGISGTTFKDYTFDFGPFDVAPNSVVACLAGGSTAGEMGSISVGVLTWTESQCTVRLWANGVTSARNPTIRWIAL